MKLSSRDKHLLVLLAAVLLATAYYYLGFLPLEQKINDKKEEVAVAEVKKNEINGKLVLETTLEDAIKGIDLQIKRWGFEYYTELQQEETLMIISDVAKSLSINMEQLSFTKLINPTTQVVHAIQVNFNGEYKEFLALLRGIRNHPKKIFVRNLNLTGSLTDEVVKGTIGLEFNVMSSIDKFSSEDVQWVKEQQNTRDLAQSPFVPYSDFVVQSRDKVVPDETPVVEPPTDNGEQSVYRPKIKVYGFEDGSPFFVGSDPTIMGSIERSKQAIEGQYALSLYLDFYNEREYSEASVVFDFDTVILNRQPEFIGLWVYAYEGSNHNIGLELMDSAGKTFKVQLTEGVDFTQWKELEASIPLGVSYPCKVNRIYVEGVGYGQKLLGKYLFDQLQVSYPVE